MDHNGEPGRPKQGDEAGANLGSGEVDRLFTSTVRSDREIPEIPEMRSLRVQVTVAVVRGIEMGSGGLEARWFAFSYGVDVEPVVSRGEPGDPHLHLELLVPLAQGYPADICALGVAENALERSWSRRAAAAREDSRQRNDYDITHLEFLHMNCWVQQV
jgi:hypothetical protein